MDETKINTFPPQRKTNAPKGLETIKIQNDDKNLKERTTYIGTSSMNSDIRFPLVVVAKGTTTLCEQKYMPHFCNDDHMLQRENFWSTSEIMIQYLDLLLELMGGRSFGFILDMKASCIISHPQASSTKIFELKLFHWHSQLE